MRIEWHIRALEELQDIYNYIHENSPQNAEKVIDTLLKLGDSIGNFPLKYPKEPYFNQESTRFLTKWNFKLIYIVSRTKES